MNYLTARGFARGMRKKSTPAERMFWDEVRGRKLLGLKFNRQFVIEYLDEFDNTQYYIPDFHCHAKKLIVEIDGKIHLSQKEADQIRENKLRLLGFHIIRFTNEEVIQDFEGVRERLKYFIEQL